MRQAALGYDGFRLVQPPRAYGLWDADRVQGCVCDLGYGGHDCRQRLCPTGDDPLTTSGQSSEQQQIVCTCGGVCSGTFAITFAGRTRRVYPAAVATVAEETGVAGSGAGPGESLQAVLNSLRDGTVVVGSVVYSSGAAGAPLCSASGNAATVNFNPGAGNAPEVAVAAGSLASSTGLLALVVRTLRNGTTEAASCSNRGTCDTTSGTCACFPGFGASNGAGGPGTIADCGAVVAAGNVTCPGGATTPCNGRGSCSGAPTYTCTCWAGYSGAACELARCPLGRAWFDEAADTNVAHGLVECSARGACDSATGICACEPGFTGVACDRLTCPSTDPSTPCSGRGRCLSLRRLAEEGRFGGSPRGSLEVQALACNLTAGNFTLLLAAGSTPDIAFSATAADLRAAIELLPDVGLVNVVTETAGATALCAAGVPGGVITSITFTSDFGNVPLLTPLLPPSLAGSTIVLNASTSVIVSTSTGGMVAMSERVPGSRVSYGEDEASASTWDADMVHGCHCDGYPDYNKTSASAGDVGEWVGAMCHQRSCAYGSDPAAANVATINADGSTGSCTPLTPEVQALSCGATAGSFTLTFRGWTTQALQAADGIAALKTALEALPSVGVVRVAAAWTNATLCAALGAATANTTITFATELGDLPTLAVATATGMIGGNVSVTTVTDGVGSNEECAGRGICDRTAGLCRCFRHYYSGDGFGGKGGRGDCGTFDSAVAPVSAQSQMVDQEQLVQLDDGSGGGSDAEAEFTLP